MDFRWLNPVSLGFSHAIIRHIKTVSPLVSLWTRPSRMDAASCSVYLKPPLYWNELKEVEEKQPPPHTHTQTHTPACCSLCWVAEVRWPTLGDGVIIPKRQIILRNTFWVSATGNDSQQVHRLEQILLCNSGRVVCVCVCWESVHFEPSSSEGERRITSGVCSPHHTHKKRPKNCWFGPRTPRTHENGVNRMHGAEGVPFAIQQWPLLFFCFNHESLKVWSPLFFIPSHCDTTIQLENSSDTPASMFHLPVSLWSQTETLRLTEISWASTMCKYIFKQFYINSDPDPFKAFF